MDKVWIVDDEYCSVDKVFYDEENVIEYLLSRIYDDANGKVDDFLTEKEALYNSYDEYCKGGTNSFGTEIYTATLMEVSDSDANREDEVNTENEYGARTTTIRRGTPNLPTALKRSRRQTFLQLATTKGTLSVPVSFGKSNKRDTDSGESKRGGNRVPKIRATNAQNRKSRP